MSLVITIVMVREDGGENISRLLVPCHVLFITCNVSRDFVLSCSSLFDSDV